MLASFGGDRHPSVRAARRSRIENLAACWGGDEVARVAARTVTAMLEAASDEDEVETDEAIDPDRAIDIVCRILADGLERAGVGQRRPQRLRFRSRSWRLRTAGPRRVAADGSARLAARRPWR